MLLRRDQRGAARPDDDDWMATLRRVRGEFEEMPSTRLTFDQATTLFGLPEDERSRALLDRLADEGFLTRTESGEYVRRSDTP